MATKSKGKGELVILKSSARNTESLRAAKREMMQEYWRTPEAAFSARTVATHPAPSTNVVGIGIGEKVRDGRPTGVLALKFLVRIKYSQDQIPKGAMLPPEVNGLPTDVEQAGTLRRLVTAPVMPPLPNPRTRMRPAQPGCSVGFRDPNSQLVMAGTFGALVKRGQRLFILSNNHVLANENSLPLGSPIFQPGLLDNGDPNQDQIARLSRFVALDVNANNKVDGAIAELVAPGLASKEILFIGEPNGKARAEVDMTVHKFGRTTDYRVGRVTSIETDVRVEYDLGVLTFEDQVIIEGLNGQPFSAAGDSGSLILERGTNRAVGLLFAGSRTHTVANHIDDVLRQLRVTLA